MRKFLGALMIGIVVLMLAAVGVLVGRSLWQQHQQDVARKGLEFLPGVSQHIQDFHRLKMRDGRKVWEISAKDARYFDEDKTVLVQQAVLQLFLADGRVVGLQGEEARILLDGREITEVQLTGDIEVRLADYVAHTQRATYYHHGEMISVPGAVEISGEALQIHGERMEISIPDQRVSLLDRVSMQFEPALLKDNGHAPL